MCCMSATKELKVAVIGAGSMGRNHVRTYSKMKNVTLVAVVDIDPSTAKMAEEYGVPFLTDYTDLFKKGAVDAVSVVVPTHLHHKVATDFMNQGIHCLVEKPIASHVEEAESLMATAERQGVVFTV